MKQIALIVMLSVVGFAVVLAVFIADRLTAEEVALLAGVVCGIGVAVPLGMMAGATLADRRRRDQSAAVLPAIYIPQPPQPMVVGSPPSSASLSQPKSPAPRVLNIIGQNALDADK